MGMKELHLNDLWARAIFDPAWRPVEIFESKGGHHATLESKAARNFLLGFNLLPLLLS